MRILIVHNKYKEKGGEDNSFAIECQMLRDHGHDVKQLVYENNNINSVISLFKLSYKLFYINTTVRNLKTVIKEFSPDIIHVHNFFYLVSPSVFFVAKRKKIPIVFTVRNYRLICSGAYLLRDEKVCELCVTKKIPIHGVIYKCHRNSYLQSFHLSLMILVHRLLGTWNTLISKYIVLTEFAKNKLINSNLKLKEHQIAVKPNFVVDTGYTSMAEREDYFLFIGRLSKEKGIDILLKSFIDTKYQLKIIGTGPLADDVINAAKNHPNIHYEGFRPNDQIINYLKKCKALVFPSIWYEGMPRTILEAYSTGTPVISTDIDNINELVIENYNGIHFKNNSAVSLAGALRNFMQKEKSETLYDNARKTYEEKYSYDSNYLMLIDIYKKLISQNVKVIKTQKRKYIPNIVQDYLNKFSYVSYFIKNQAKAPRKN